MEETNYDRAAYHDPPRAVASPQVLEDVADDSKTAKSKASSRPSFEDAETGQVAYPRKSYWQNLSLKDKKRPNRMVDVAFAAFKGFTYPSVVYAG